MHRLEAENKFFQKLVDISIASRQTLLLLEFVLLGNCTAIALLITHTDNLPPSKGRGVLLHFVLQLSNPYTLQDIWASGHILG